MKKLIIAGTTDEVKRVIKGLIKRYGKDTKLEDVIDKFNKEEVILV